MPRISPERWTPGSVDEACAVKLEAAIAALNLNNVLPTIALFDAAFAAGFSEPLIAHGPAMLRRTAVIITGHPSFAARIGEALLPFMQNLAALEANRLTFVTERLA